MPEEKMSPSSPQLAIVEHQGVAVALSAKEVASIYKKSRQSGIPFDTLEEVYRRGYSAWTPELNETPTQTAFNRVNSFIAEGAAAAMDSDLINEKRGLWDNIHAKRERIKRGSGERMRKPGEKGAPTAAALKAAQEETQIDEIVVSKRKFNVGSLPKHAQKEYKKYLETHKEKLAAAEIDSDDTPAKPFKHYNKQSGDYSASPSKMALRHVIGAGYNKKEYNEERYMGAEKASNDPNDPASRFVGDARVYMKDTPGQEENLKHLEGGSKLKTIKRVIKEGDSRVRSSNVKDIVMNSPYGTAVSMLGLQNRLEPKTVEAYARSVGVPVNNGMIGPASASSLSKNIKKVYNYDVSPEKIKGYANTFGLSVGEAYEEIVQMIEEQLQEDAKGYKSPSGGLTQKGRDHYNRTTGSNLKAPVTTKPSKLKKGSKAAKRRKSFCARMGGMKKRLTSAKTARDPDSRINKALRKWNC